MLFKQEQNEVPWDMDGFVGRMPKYSLDSHTGK